MNLKTVFGVGILFGVALFQSGCSTTCLLAYSKKKTWDTFQPQALYQQTNGTRLAMKGDLFKNVPQEKAYAGKGLRQCLVLPDAGRWQLPTEGKEWQWLSDYHNSLCNLAKDSALQDSVPPSYCMVTALPTNHATIPMPNTERRPHAWSIAFVPITAAWDIATAPLQLIGYAIFFSRPM